MAERNGWILLGPPATRLEKLKLWLYIAMAGGCLVLPALATHKIVAIIPILSSSCVLFPIFFWILPKVLKLPKPNSERIPKDLIEKIDEVRERIGLKRLIVQNGIAPYHPQVAVLNGSVNLSEHVLNQWPQEAILWQIEVELRVAKKLARVLIISGSISMPLCGAMLASQGRPIFEWLVATVFVTIVGFFAYLYRIETTALLETDSEVTKTEEARAAAKIALSDPYFHNLGKKWYDRTVSISSRTLKRRADNLGIVLEKPIEATP